MTNRTKILLLIAIILIIFGIVYIKKENKPENSLNNTEKNIFSELENDNIQNVVENTTEKEVNNMVENNTTNTIIVGKEEAESNQENTYLTEQETAIKMAQKEWGLDINSYIFEANANSDGTFKITVRNKTDRNAIAQYTVNVKTNTITEE